MARQVGYRVVMGLASILGASIVSFLLLRIAPANPTRLILGEFATSSAVAELTKSMGLNLPLWHQYWNYISGFFQGNWGYSYALGAPVSSLISSKLPATIELGLYAFVMAVVGALFLALLATYRRRPHLDRAVRGFSYLGLGVAPFWVALLLLILLFEDLPLFPGPEGRLSANVAPPSHITGLYTVDALLTGNWTALGNALWHLVLPAFALALVPMAYLVRLLRANLLDVSREPFLLVSRGNGLSRWATSVRHALPNAVLPTLTASGLVLGQLLAGSVLIERVFDWPGVGNLVTNGILSEDYSTVQAFILLSACVYVVVNTIVEILALWIDPRLRNPRRVQ